MAEESNSYKDSLKATSLFGGVQVFNILIGILRSKFAAVLLGTSGMGIMGLYTSTTSLVNAVCSLGISSSAVRNIAEANATGDKDRITKVISVFRKLVWFTGLLGLVLCFVFAPWLSQFSFGNKDFSVGFKILSCTLLFQQLTSGQNTLMQGLHRYAYLAKANVVGNTIGLFVTIPLYYLWGEKAIVPVIVLSGVISMILAYYYSGKLGVKSVPVSFSEIKGEGKNMIVMGIMMSLSNLLALASSYLVRVFISNNGSIDDVGLFNAGFAIVNSYVGMVFTAMATDYYPRLSAVANNASSFSELINNQIEIALLLMAPIIVAFIAFIRPVIILLYSNLFIPIEGMICWAGFAMFFKAVSWAIAYSYPAKGDAKSFFFNESSAIVYQTVLNIFFYKYWGLSGVGISFLIGYFIYMIQVWVVCSHKYNLVIKGSILRILFAQLPMAIVCLVLANVAGPVLKYSVGVIMLVISIYISYIGLDKRIGIWETIKRRLH